MKKNTTSQDTHTPSQQLPIAANSTETILRRLQTELQNVKETEISRPARYYKAYKAYTKAYGIEILEKLIASCSPIEREKVSELLLQYKNYNPEI